MNKNNYRPDDPNRLDLFKSEISSTRGSIVTCVEPNDPNRCNWYPTELYYLVWVIVLRYRCK